MTTRDDDDVQCWSIGVVHQPSHDQRIMMRVSLNELNYLRNKKCLIREWEEEIMVDAKVDVVVAIMCKEESDQAGNISMADEW